MHWLDVLIILGFIAYALVSGLRSRSVASQNLEEYFLAGRSLPGWKAGLSMAATQFAADTPLVVMGIIATAGIFHIWRFWIYGLAFLLMGFVLAASWRRARVITDAELTEVRYGQRPAAALRGIKSVYFGLVFNCTVLAMVLLAATRIAEPFLTWNEWLPASIIQGFAGLFEAIQLPLTVVPDDPSQWPADVWITSANNAISILAIVVVTAFYSTTGGLRSVVNTDVMQFVLMMGGTIIFAWIVADQAGGLWALPEKIRAAFARGGATPGIDAKEVLAFTPSTAKDATLAVLAVYAIQWIAQINADGTGYLAQRSMACRTDQDAKLAAIIFTFAQILIRSIAWLPIGLGLILLFPVDGSLSGSALVAEREFTFVRGISELLPAGVKGLMITGMLAALASTVDTHLNWGSSYMTNDIYRRFICGSWLKREPSGRSLVWVARGANVFILVVALTIMTQLTSIKEAWENSLLLGAGVGIPLVLRWVWWRLNGLGELASIAASLLMLPVVLGFVDGDASKLLLMAISGTAASVVVSLLTAPEAAENLQAFYRRAKPPGFWAPVAKACGDAPSESKTRLQRGVGAMVLCAFSVFCLLTGIGSWVAASPPPTWFPWRTPWVLSLIVIGVGITPIWWRLGFGRTSLLQLLTGSAAAAPAADTAETAADSAALDSSQH